MIAILSIHNFKVSLTIFKTYLSRIYFFKFLKRVKKKIRWVLYFILVRVFFATINFQWRSVFVTTLRNMTEKVAFSLACKWYLEVASLHRDKSFCTQWLILQQQLHKLSFNSRMIFAYSHVSPSFILKYLVMEKHSHIKISRYRPSVRAPTNNSYKTKKFRF